MKRLIGLVILLIGTWMSAMAQVPNGYTAVTATVEDANDSLYTNGTYNVSIVDPGTNNQQLLLNGQTFQKVYSGQVINSLGQLSIALPDNSVLDNSGDTGSQWTFSICSAQYNTPSVQKYCFMWTGRITGSSMSITSQLQAVAAILPRSGGGGGTPAGSDGSVQINQVGSFGAAAGFALNSSTSPSLFTVPFSESIKGPRPYLDVTAYGAKGDGSTDDTAAITSAINAACAFSASQRPVVFFPPGLYIVSQPQGGSGVTTPVLPWCSQLKIQGSGGVEAGQFSMAGTSAIEVSHGGNPGSGPVFGPTGFSLDSGVIQNMTLYGYNQAVYLNGSGAGTGQSGNGFTFDNDAILFQNSGYADNVGIKISSTIQVSWKGGTIQAPDGSHDDVLLIGADTGQTEIQPTALIFFDGTGGNFWIGDGIHYDQRVNTCCSGPGNIHISNILVEDATGAIFRVTNSSGVGGSTSLPLFSDLELVNYSISDSGSAQSILNFNSSGSELSGLYMRGDQLGSSAAVAAVMIPGGILQACRVLGGGITLNTTIEDGSGNTLGDCMAQVASGARSIVNTSNLFRLSSDLFNNGPAWSAYSAGNQFASVGLDSVDGLMFNQGNAYGFSSEVTQDSQAAVDIGTATTLPPTNVAGTATTGGSLSPATYYYYIRNSTAVGCSATTMSAPSLPSNAVVVSGSNNAVTLTWTQAPLSAGTGIGYCVVRTNIANYSPTGQYFYFFVSGESTTSFTDTNTGPSCCLVSAAYNPMTVDHRFTYNSLGVNTLNPQYNLDVNGDGHFATTMTLTPRVFSTLGTCNSALAGSIAAITDSITNTWGATITGGGSDPVMGYCDGINWTVMAK